MLQVISSRDTEAMERLLARGGNELAAAEKTVAPIVAAVRRQGDRGLLAWSRKLDGERAARNAAALAIAPEEMEAAWRRVSPALRQALRQAQRNIARMATWQTPKPWRRPVEPGVVIGQQVSPLASVGCYVPGGRHPLPSTLLMTAVPARVAGVERIVVICPQPSDEVLAAAHLAGVRELYRVGGAQGVAALAYGTRTIGKVDKIVGPGNIYVTAAKKLVWADCAIDFLAGPTEVLVVGEAGDDPDFLASDLIAQAEHDPQTVAWLLTPSKALARRVGQAVARQLRAAPNPVAERSLTTRGAIVLVASLAEAAAIANRIAPEHISIPASLLGEIRNAGSIFVGAYAPQSVGDYLSGTNHVLPTASLARLRGGLSAADFVKVVTVQQLTRAGLNRLAPAITTLARAEGLEGHARSVEVRLGRAAATSKATAGRRAARPARRRATRSGGR